MAKHKRDWLEEYWPVLPQDEVGEVDALGHILEEELKDWMWYKRKERIKYDSWVSLWIVKRTVFQRDWEIGEEADLVGNEKQILPWSY